MMTTSLLLVRAAESLLLAIRDTPSGVGAPSSMLPPADTIIPSDATAVQVLDEVDGSAEGVEVV